MATRGFSFWRTLGWLVLAAAVVLAVVTAISLTVALNQLPSDLLVTVDGERVDLQALQAGHWFLAIGGVVLATLIVLLVVPMALLLGVGLPLVLAGLGLVAALLATALALALVGSPLILLGLLVWWAMRPRRPTGAAMPSAPAAPPRVPVVGQHTDNATPLA